MTTGKKRKIFCRCCTFPLVEWEGERATPQSRQSARFSLQSSKLAPPAPSAASECRPSPLGPRGEAHSSGGRGWGEPIRTKGQPLWLSIGVEWYCIIPLRATFKENVRPYGRQNAKRRLRPPKLSVSGPALVSADGLWGRKVVG